MTINIRLPAKDAADLVKIAKQKLRSKVAPDTGKHEMALDIDGIYIGLMPASAQDSDDQTIVDITEVTDLLEVYGSNIPTDRSQRVAVNIYYGLEKIDYMDLIEKEIESIFLSNQWSIIVSEPHRPDPDTAQETKVYQFSRKVENDYKGE